MKKVFGLLFLVVLLALLAVTPAKQFSRVYAQEVPAADIILRDATLVEPTAREGTRRVRVPEGEPAPFIVRATVELAREPSPPVEADSAVVDAEWFFVGIPGFAALWHCRGTGCTIRGIPVTESSTCIEILEDCQIDFHPEVPLPVPGVPVTTDVEVWEFTPEGNGINTYQITVRASPPPGVIDVNPENNSLTFTFTIESLPTPVGGVGFFPAAAGSSGPSAGLLVGVIVASTAGAIALGGAAWYGRRRWQR